MASIKDEVLATLASVASPDGRAARRHGQPVGHRRHRRQGVLFHHRRCRRGEAMGSGARARRGGDSRAAGRAVGHGRAHRRARRRQRRGARRPRPRAASGAGQLRPRARAGRPAPAGIPGVGAIIAVASGKGGVGKSTVAVNLALGLRDLGLKVGILDADIYGPSMPKLLAIRERPQTVGGTRLKPIVRHGMPVMSIGFLVEEETPMIWRGPMVMSALTQMLREVEWGTLDVMVVDMPPGTGDAQLTMAQQVPLKGAVIVSTPQDLGADRRAARHRHVPPRQCAGARHRREHEHASSARIAARARIFSATAARGTRPSGSACRSWAKCRWRSTSGKNPTPARRWSRPNRTARMPRSSATSPRACATACMAAGRPAPKIVIEA